MPEAERTTRPKIVLDHLTKSFPTAGMAVDLAEAVCIPWNARRKKTL